MIFSDYHCRELRCEILMHKHQINLNNGKLFSFFSPFQVTFSEKVFYSVEWKKVQANVNMFAWETFGVFEHFVPYILTCSILTTVWCLSLTSVRWANSMLMNEYSESRLIYDLYVRWLKRKYTDFNIRRKVFPFLLESMSFFPTNFFHSVLCK